MGWLIYVPCHTTLFGYFTIKLARTNNVIILPLEYPKEIETVRFFQFMLCSVVVKIFTVQNAEIWSQNCVNCWSFFNQEPDALGHLA